MGIESWLRELGLDQYIEAFRNNDVDTALLGSLTAEDLKEIGITSVGHRRRLLDAIAARSRVDEHAARIDTPPAASAAPAGAERRQLTVMFVDLVGSTALAELLDPEEMGAVLRAYQNAVAGEIARFEGHVAKFMGDGVLAYFGWPAAHEDEAERAVRAGLAVCNAVGRLGSGDSPLACRVGIATGLVVVGELIGQGMAQEQAVVGETPNLASRLQTVAEPGQVLITATTRQLVGAAFELTPLAAQTLKGLSAPVTPFAVLGERAAGSRFEAKCGAGFLPMVGRDQELALLLERWNQARNGEGQGVLLVGEAGIGKSRITRALLDAVRAVPHVRVRFQCSPYHADSAFWPVIQQLFRAAGFVDQDTPEQQLDKLESVLGKAGDVTAAQLLADLLGLDGTARYGAIELTPQAQRTRTLRALIDQILGLARQQPVLLVLEDAHWIDPTTLELVEQALDLGAAAPVLLLLTSRPENQPALAGHPHVTRLTLNRLGRAGVEAIVERLSSGTFLPAEAIDTIIARTDGVPLFVEELTKAVLESGAASVPASLHDSLMSRLDRLPEVKEVAQIAAVIGREFSYELLASVADKPEHDVIAALDRLSGAELLFPRGTPPAASYIFKHALLRDTAYESMLRSKRRKVHLALLRAMESGIAAARPEVMARHASEAGQTSRAVDLLLQAGEEAIAKSAMVEAVSHFRTGLAFLQQMSGETADRQRTLRLQSGLARALAASEGYSTPETGAAFAHAAKLARETGDQTSLISVLYGLYMFHLNRSELDPAHELAAELMTLARGAGDEQALLIGVRALGTTAMWRGRFVEAISHQEAALKLFDAGRERRQPGAFSHDPLVSILSNLAWILLAIGRPNKALARSEAAVDEARSLGHPVSLAVALHRSCQFRHLSRDLEPVHERVGELLQIADEHNLPFFRAFALSFSGSLGGAMGLDSRVGMIRTGLDTLDGTGVVLLRPYMASLLADGLARENQNAESLAIMNDALAAIECTGERWFESELLRKRALALMSTEGGAAALGSFKQAIEVARRQDALFWELRASRDLARLWAEVGERQRALDLLAPVYDRFTEGFDTPDLIEARTLLDEL